MPYFKSEKMKEPSSSLQCHCAAHHASHDQHSHHIQSLLFTRNVGESLGSIDPLVSVTETLLHKTPVPFPRIFTTFDSKRISGDVSLTELHNIDFQPEDYDPCPCLSPVSSTSSYNSPLDTPLSTSSRMPTLNLSCLPPDDDKNRPTTGSPAEIFSAAFIDTTMDDVQETSGQLLHYDSPPVSLDENEPAASESPRGKVTLSPSITVQAVASQKGSVRKAKTLTRTSRPHRNPKFIPISTTNTRSPTPRGSKSLPNLPTPSTSAIVDVTDTSSTRPSRVAKRKIGIMNEGDLDESFSESEPLSFHDGDDDDYKSDNDKAGPSRKKTRNATTSSTPAPAPALASMEPARIGKVGNYRFMCPAAGCRERFTRKHDAERHIQTIHSEKSFSCSVCGKVLSRLDACRRHEQQQHGLCSKPKASGPPKRKRSL